jgi:hypothetical protein
MKYLFHLQIDLESKGNNGAVLRETVSKLKQVISLLEGSRSIHRGGFADDTCFVDYWYTIQSTLEVSDNVLSNRDLVRHRCSECNGTGEINSSLQEGITIECPHCDAKGEIYVK